MTSPKTPEQLDTFGMSGRVSASRNAVGTSGDYSTAPQNIVPWKHQVIKC